MKSFFRKYSDSFLLISAFVIMFCFLYFVISHMNNNVKRDNEQRINKIEEGIKSNKLQQLNYKIYTTDGRFFIVDENGYVFDIYLHESIGKIKRDE